MIQVLARINNILDLIACDPGGVSLKSIEEATGLNKGTVCNLLKSLCEIGYVEKKQSGIYLLGPKLVKLAYPYFLRDSLFTAAAETTRALAQESQEAALLAVRKDDQLQVLAREIFDQNIVLNTRLFDSLPGYHTAVGHIFMAFDPQLDLPAIYQQQPQLTAMYDNFSLLTQKLDAIRKDGHLVITLHGGQTCVIAVPVYRGGKFAAALALMVPAMRFSAGKQPLLLAMTLKYGKKMSNALL